MQKSLVLAFGLILVTAQGFDAVAAAPPKFLGEGFSPRFVEKASCDINKDDKQARCMESCDEIWIKATQAYNGNIEKAKVDKKACEAQCGC